MLSIDSGEQRETGRFGAPWDQSVLSRDEFEGMHDSGSRAAVKLFGVLPGRQYPVREGAILNIPLFVQRTSPRARIVPIAIACGLLFTLSACASDGSYNTINGSVHVIAGKPAEGASTINGSIKIDDDAAADAVSTVNGSINLGARATAKSLSTVNGSITVNEAAHTPHVKAVNGDLTVNQTAESAAR